MNDRGRGGSDEPADGEADLGEDGPPGPATREEVATLREQVESLEDELESRTVPREEIEADLRRYVRSRIRRGHAQGWGPYLVLLYGTGMTLGAFHFLSGGWAVLAMLVVWLSTLGLYVVMLVVGAVLTVAGTPGRALAAIRNWRS